MQKPQYLVKKNKPVTIDNIYLLEKDLNRYFYRVVNRDNLSLLIHKGELREPTSTEFFEILELVKKEEKLHKIGEFELWQRRKKEY